MIMLNGKKEALSCSKQLPKYSDESYRLSAKDIGDWLEREYSQKVDRKTIKRNLMNERMDG